MSAPAESPMWSEELTTSTLTPSSSRATATCSRISASICVSIALRASGRSSRNTATPSVSTPYVVRKSDINFALRSVANESDIDAASLRAQAFHEPLGLVGGAADQAGDLVAGLPEPA